MRESTANTFFAALSFLMKIAEQCSATPDGVAAPRCRHDDFVEVQAQGIGVGLHLGGLVAALAHLLEDGGNLRVHLLAYLRNIGECVQGAKAHGQAKQRAGCIDHQVAVAAP